MKLFQVFCKVSRVETLFQEVNRFSSRHNPRLLEQLTQLGAIIDLHLALATSPIPQSPGISHKKSPIVATRAPKGFCRRGLSLLSYGQGRDSGCGAKIAPRGQSATSAVTTAACSNLPDQSSLTWLPLESRGSLVRLGLFWASISAIVADFRPK